MEHDTSTELGYNAFLLDVLCTVLAFLAAFWLRRFLPDEGTVDLFSHCKRSLGLRYKITWIATTNSRFLGGGIF